MCGLVGFLGGTAAHGQHAALSMPSILKSMADKIAHRGPDSDGYWSDSECQIGLGHRRLAIVDLSPAGFQPMQSASSRYVLAFNGEIYNHQLLRKEIEQAGKAPNWRGHSDTETLLAGIDAWGLSATLLRSIGMFAIALWDKQTQTLTLARDRMGEKPLYYGWQGAGNQRSFIFGSELKALRVHPAFENNINRGAISLLLRHNAIPAPYSIYQGIAKLPAGSLLTVSMAKQDCQITRYWQASHCAQLGVKNRFTGSATEAVDQLEVLLKDAIGQQMMADVPLGAFLSGGVDSSTIVALMQSQSNRPVNTFTIGFNEAGYNEAQHAQAVATHLGANHTELIVTQQQAMDVIGRLPTLYDEPFSDSSQIPTFLVSQLARQHVTVSLSGDAGDELFCGYNRYQMTAQLWQKLSVVPRPLRRAAAQILLSIAPHHWDYLARPIHAVLPSKYALANLGDKLHKGASVLPSETVDALYLALVSHWQNPASVVINGTEPATVLTDKDAPDYANLATLSEVERMMALDMLTYLPDDILTKVDRAAMGVALESRVPLLDHRVVEFAWRLPQEYKLRDGQTKWALRQVLYRHVPKALIERPKVGFAVPIGQWLRTGLRDWAETLLAEDRLRQEGFFNPAPIRQKWAAHLSGKQNWQHHLWDVLMFQSWLEQQ